MKAFIKTFGCQMNEQDSAQMYALLHGIGYAKAKDTLDADLILLNTCSIREKAAHKIYSELGRVRPLKEHRAGLIVGIAGCVAEQEKEKLSARFPFLDLVFGPDHIRHLPKLIQDVLNTRQQGHPQTIEQTGFDLRQDFKFINILPATGETPSRAFVNIQKGCDNICAFCIVPFVRGREVSRPHDEIIDEINALTQRGVKEVTLLGQNVNSYGLKTPGAVSFATLLALIAKKTTLQRLRFTTSHPKDVKDDLIEQYAHNPILAPQFHLPVQSGANRILKLMRRQYTIEDYLAIIDKLKKQVPDLRFSTDIIVGFPTETQDEFAETLKLMRTVRFDQTFSFVYSQRPYTQAAKITDDIPAEVKSERLKRLQALDKEITMENNHRDVGSIQEVLVEERDEENTTYPLMGRSATNKVVHFSGEVPMGEISRVRIVQANPHSLYGEVATNLRENFSVTV